MANSTATCGADHAKRAWPFSRRTATLLLAVLAAAALAFVWRNLGPVELGGKASYVTTEGTSMLPRFKADGLVITRTQSAYRVGDVVAYHNRQLHTVVMHRIVGIEDGRYIFKGDNNNFHDSYEPTRSELVGRKWLYLPRAGSFVTYFRQPIVFALGMALIGLVAGSSLAASSTEGRRARHAS